MIEFEGTPVKRVDVSGTRFYYKQEQEDLPWEEKIKAPSVTSIIDDVLAKGYGFNKWLGDSASFESAMAYGKETALVGTIVHSFADRMVQGETINLPAFKGDTTPDSAFYDSHSEEIEEVWPRIKPITNRLIGLKKFWAEKSPKPIATEVSLFDPLFAGTIDLVAKLKFNRKVRRAMIDYKTGKDVDAYGKGLQLTAYKELWDKLFPEEPIELLFNLFLGEKGGYTLVRREFNPEGWKSMVELWYNRYPNPPKEPVKLPTTFTLEEEDE